MVALFLRKAVETSFHPKRPFNKQYILECRPAFERRTNEFLMTNVCFIKTHLQQLSVVTASNFIAIERRALTSSFAISMCKTKFTTAIHLFDLYS